MGGVLLVCAALLAPTAPVLGAPAATWLVTVVALAGLVLLLRVPNTGSEASAAALGAAVPLALAAPLSGRPVAATIAAGAALAVIGSAAWWLRRRREWAPWYGTRGVVAAAVGALLVLGFGGVVLGSEAVAAGGLSPALAGEALQTFVPWALLVALSGWLRRVPAIALLVPAVAQVVVVVA
jgi:hypothetical protein